MANAERHHLHIARSSWGNTRPQFALCLNLLLLHPTLRITFIGSIDNKAQIEADLSRWDLSDTSSPASQVEGSSVRERLDLILLGEASNEARSYAKSNQAEEIMATQFDGVYRALLQGKEPWDGVKGSTVPPNLVVAALATHKWVMKTKKEAEVELGIPQEGEGRIKMFAFFGMSGLLAGYIFGGGPNSIPWQAMMRDQQANGTTIHDTYYQYRDQDVVERTPGIPPFYRYEGEPCAMMRALPDPFVSIGKALKDYIDECDGFVSPYLPDLEPEADKMWQSCFTRSGAQWYGVGPQFAPDYWRKDETPGLDKDYSSGESGTAAMRFLDRALATYGEKSVINISSVKGWGSSLLPTEVGHLKALFQTLNEAEPPLPYLVAMPNKSLPVEVAEIIESSGRGLALGWVPQQSVLKHKAVGWQLTHGGANSTSECLLNQVPMICWPIFAEQPWGFMINSQTHKIVLPLYQPRKGYGIGKPVYATGEVVKGTEEAVAAEVAAVIRKARGEEGAQIRKNVEHWSEVMRNSREDGLSYEGMVALGSV